MKKFISLMLAIVMCFVCTFTVAAEESTISFPMVNTTGVIYLKGSSKIETNFVPEEATDDSIIIAATDAIPNITSVVLEVEGRKYGNPYTTIDRYNFVNYNTIDAIQPNYQNTGDYWKLNIYHFSAPAGEFLVENFDVIYSLNIIAMGNFETESSKVYYDWGNTITKTDVTVSAFTIQKPFNTSTTLNNTITNLIPTVRAFNYYNKEVKYDYAFIGNTDLDRDGVASRNEIRILSYSELGVGRGISGFEGLASQITNFFNKKTNGKIIFNLTTAAPLLSQVWNEGGIPSTQVGIFDTTQKISNDVIGLFFNYDTTGSLLARGKIVNNSIEFDISDVLKAIDGNTIATIRTVYYGLIGGIDYTNLGRGFKIESVVLSCEEENAVETTTTAITTTPTIEEVIDEIVPEKTPAITTAPDAVIIEETTTQITAPEVIIDANTETSTSDENPHTGVSLIIFPTVLAAAVGVFARKKR